MDTRWPHFPRVPMQEETCRASTKVLKNEVKLPVALINSRCVCIWLLHTPPNAQLKKTPWKVTRQITGNGCGSEEGRG